MTTATTAVATQREPDLLGQTVVVSEERTTLVLTIRRPKWVHAS